MVTVASLRALQVVAEADYASETLQLGEGEALVCSVQAPYRDEGGNEDCALLATWPDGQVLLAVADGMGGANAGEVASKVAIEALHREVEMCLAEGENIRIGVMNGFEAANRKVIELGVGAGTTLTVATIHDGSLRYFHVGDSMLLVTGQRGKLKLRSIAHSPIGYGTEGGWFDEEDALLHPERNLVSNVLGSQSMHVEVGGQLKLAPLDTVVLASDGLSDNLGIQEIVDGARVGRLDRAANRLLDGARGRMAKPVADQPSHPDDLTLVLFRPTSGANSAPN